MAKGKRVNCYRRPPDENALLVSPGAKQPVKLAADIEKIAWKFNKKYDIKLESVWNQEDSSQQCYCGFYDNQNISGHIQRAWFNHLQAQKGAKPPKENPESFKERLQHEKVIAGLLGYDVKAWLRYWRKDKDPQRERGWYKNAAQNKEQERVLLQYKQGLIRRATPPIIVGGKRTVFIDNVPQKRFVDGKQIQEVAESKYALPDVDRPVIVEGGEVVPRRTSAQLADDIKLPDETEGDRAEVESEAYEYKDFGQSWGDYSGYVRDDV